MQPITATVTAGRVEVQVPSEWPEGTVVVIHPLSQVDSSVEDEAMTPEEIARILAAMDKVEAFDLPSEVAADLEDWERKVKEYSIANMDRGIEDVFR